MLLATCVAFQARPARAQGAAGAAWSAPVNVSNTTTDSDFPAMVADARGIVHLFWSESLDASQASADTIYYARWDGSTWSTPVDILFSPEGPQSTASAPAALATPDGRLHLVWTGGWTGRIYHSSAWAGEAGSARAWSVPVELNRDRAGGGAPAVALGSDGTIHVVYPVALEPEQGIYHISSADAGAGWSAPEILPDSRLGAEAMLADARIAIGEDGTMHVTWTWSAYPETFPAKGIYYARSSGPGSAWTEPLMLADGPFSYGEIAAAADQVHVVWSGTAELRSKYHCWSPDGGLTWPAPAAVVTPGGLQGYAALAADSAGILHWVTVSSYPSMADPLLHLAWDGLQWTRPAIVISMEALGLEVGQNMSNAAVAVREGNEIVAAVTVPYGQGAEYQNEIYVAHARTGALRVQPQPLTTAVSRPTEEPAVPAPVSEAAPVAPTGSPERLPQDQAVPPSPTAGPAPLIVGVSSVVLILALSMVVVELRKRRR